MTNYMYLIITLNVNGLNAPIKDRVAEWIRKDPYICCLQKTHLRSKNTHGLKINEIKKRFIMQMNF